MRPLNVRADEPAERAILIEHGATAHPGIEAGAYLVAGKRQHDSVTTPFMNLTHDADTRHELIVENDVEFTIAVLGRASPTSPVAERGNTLADARCEGIDDRRVSTEGPLRITAPGIRRDMEKSDVRGRMGDSRDNIPSHVLGTRQHLNR